LITLITGAPGAGKTAALVDLLREIAAQGRAIYVDGIPELVIEHKLLDDARRWPELVPDGAAVVIDEVQRVWRPAGSSAKVPPDIEALETHRHKGLDFFIVTQHPNLVHQNVRRLVGRHIHLRDVGILGRHWYEWPEASNPETFRTAPVKKRYTLPKKAFGLYKSASMHIKPIRSIPRSIIVLGVSVLLCAGLAYRAVSSVGGRIAAAQDQGQGVKAGAAPSVVARQEPGTGTATPSAAAGVPPVSEPPVVGCISMKDRCLCIDAQGFPRSVEWQVCKTTAASYAGLVPLSVAASQAQPAPKVAAVSVASDAPAVGGVVSLGGDPRSHLRQ
jgi:zona occludens toxin